MSEYIYFVASLPSVWMDKASPISYKDFMKIAKEQLSERDYTELQKATFKHTKDDSNNHIIRDWDHFNYTLKSFLTEGRAKKLGIEDEKYKATVLRDENLIKEVEKILALSDPLKAEEALLSLYFDFISSHPVSSPFSLDALIIYALKLQIKERKEAFTREKGREEFEKLYSTVELDIKNRSTYGI